MKTSNIDIRKHRLQLLERHLNKGRVKIMEIGALDSPTFTKNEADIYYVDYQSKGELIDSNKDNPRYTDNRLVEIDYECKNVFYSETINEKFDLVIANHVIEHIPDMISWLQELLKILNKNGFLFLSIPDNRFTFDILRKKTSFRELIERHELRQEKPGFDQIFEMLFFYRPVRAADVWSGQHEEKLLKKRYTVSEAKELAQKYSQQVYFDVHCSVFDFDSFKIILKKLIKDSYIKCDVIDTIEPIFMGNEFNIILQK